MLYSSQNNFRSDWAVGIVRKKMRICISFLNLKTLNIMRSISSEMSKNHYRIIAKIQIHIPFGFFRVEFHS